MIEAFLLFLTLPIVISFSLLIVASRKYPRLFKPIANLALTPVGYKIFSFLATISTHPWKWLLVGKTIDTTGKLLQNSNSTTLETTTQYIGKGMSAVGNAISVSSAFLISENIAHFPIAWTSFSSFTKPTPIRVIPKALQGFLLSFDPFLFAHSFAINYTISDNSYSSLEKAFKFGVRDGIEFALENSHWNQGKVINKGFALLLTEHSVTKTAKTLLREEYRYPRVNPWSYSSYSSPS